MPQPERTALDAPVLEDCRTAAVWRFAIDAPGTWFRLVELWARLRDLIGRLPYGDRRLLVRRDLYAVAG
jgi:hypothetical protein